MLITELSIVVGLTLVNGVLAMSELAILSARRSMLEAMAKRGSAGAQSALSLLDDPSKLLSTVQIGITLVGVIAGAYSGATIGGRLGAWLNHVDWIAPHGMVVGVSLTVAVITYVSLIFGELVPKRLALASAEQVSAIVAIPMTWLARFASPLVWVLKLSTEAVLRILGMADSQELPVTGEEIRSLVHRGAQAGVFNAAEKQLMEGVLRLSSRPVRVVMQPRSAIAWIDSKSELSSITELESPERYSRLVVCDGVIEKPIGMVKTKEIVARLLRGERCDVRDVLLPIIFVPEGISLLNVLERFRNERVHMGIVISEFGATEGLVTLADVLESMAGELPELGEEQDELIQQLDERTWLIDGSFPLDEIEDRTGFHGFESSRSVEKMSAFVLQQLARMPEVGDSFVFQAASFEVAAMTGLRVDSVRMTLQKQSPEAGEPARVL